MFFKIVPPSSRISNRDREANTVYLIEDRWDDWFEFETLFGLVYVDEKGVVHNIGSVKIGQFKMPKDKKSPDLPRTFNEIGENSFSLGQDTSYYENLNQLGDELRDKILSGLNDIAKDSELYEKAKEIRVTKISLLRDVSPTSVKGQFRRLSLGGASLSRYEFTYTAARNAKSSLPPISLSFKVEPESNPPTNIHVLIGRNGVGKTHLINNMINSIIDEGASKNKVGYFSSTTDKGERTETGLFASVVSVTFSAFDETEPLPERKDKTNGIRYSYVGLKRQKKTGESTDGPKSPLMLKNEFVKALEACKNSGKIPRWKRAVEKLEADPIFREAEIAGIVNETDNDKFKEDAAFIFKNLSSGHKIVLLTVTRLIETVEEKTLVLLDEPEAHLHPPLLSAFVRALSDLLMQRNGVAIVATHSPVVLQEVPSSCVWKLRRTGAEAIVERPEIESFGENVGVLTREVFGLEVTHSGFHNLLREAIDENNDYNRILYLFNNELGMEAKGILRALLNSKQAN